MKEIYSIHIAITNNFMHSSLRYGVPSYTNYYPKYKTQMYKTYLAGLLSCTNIWAVGYNFCDNIGCLILTQSASAIINSGWVM